MAWLWRTAASRCRAVVRLPQLSRRAAVPFALGILLAGVSRHRLVPGLVLHWLEAPVARGASAAVAQPLLRRRHRLPLRHAADPCRLLRAAHVFHPPRAAFRAASHRRLPGGAGYLGPGAVG